MKEIVFYFVLLILACLWIGNVKISNTTPFIQVKHPLMAIGLFLFTIGITCMFLSKYRQGRKQGHKEAIEYLESKTLPASDTGEQ